MRIITLGTDLIYTNDLRTGETRQSLLQDVANASRMVDYCKNIDFTALLRCLQMCRSIPVHAMLQDEPGEYHQPVFFTAP